VCVHHDNPSRRREKRIRGKKRSSKGNSLHRIGEVDTEATSGGVFAADVSEADRNISEAELIARTRRDGFWEKPGVQVDFQRLIGNVRGSLVEKMKKK